MRTYTEIKGRDDRLKPYKGIKIFKEYFVRIEREYYTGEVIKVTRINNNEDYPISYHVEMEDKDFDWWLNVHVSFSRNYETLTELKKAIREHSIEWVEGDYRCFE